MLTLSESADVSLEPRIFVALGSNLGQSDLQLEQALQQILQQPKLTLLACSSLYASSPMGPSDQPDFVNAVCELQTPLPPENLLDLLQGIENSCGRQRNGERWGPRTLDLDILLYAQQQIQSPRLTVPHPGILERSFVLLPLLEIAPMICVPGHGAACHYLSSIEMYGIRRLREIKLPTHGLKR